jgi:hypothetical protein
MWLKGYERGVFECDANQNGPRETTSYVLAIAELIFSDICVPSSCIALLLTINHRSDTNSRHLAKQP